MNAEELSQQFGERLPGGFKAAARAMNMTTAELRKATEQGEITAEELFPRLSEELMEMANRGDQLSKAINNTGAAFNRMGNNVWLANARFNEAGFDKTIRDILNAASTAINRATPVWEMLGAATEHLGVALRGPLELFGSIGEKLGLMSDVSTETSGKLKLLALAFATAYKWSRKLLLTMFLILPAMSGISKLIDGENLTWAEWAITLAGVSLLLGAIVKRLADAKKGWDAFRGKTPAPTTKTPSGGSSGGSTSTSSASRLGRVGRFFGGGLGAAFAGVEGAQELWGTDMMKLFTGRIDESRMASLLSGEYERQLYPAIGRTGALTVQEQEQARQTIINGGITFEITGDNAREISDEVLRVINEEVIRPASMNDPNTEK